jgi:hypothetical protein
LIHKGNPAFSRLGLYSPLENGLASATLVKERASWVVVVPMRRKMRNAIDATLMIQTRSPALKAAGTAAAKTAALRPVAELAKPGIAPQMRALMDDQRL